MRNRRGASVVHAALRRVFLSTVATFLVYHSTFPSQQTSNLLIGPSLLFVAAAGEPPTIPEISSSENNKGTVGIEPSTVSSRILQFNALYAEFAEDPLFSSGANRPLSTNENELNQLKKQLTMFQTTKLQPETDASQDPQLQRILKKKYNSMLPEVKSVLNLPSFMGTPTIEKLESDIKSAVQEINSILEATNAIPRQDAVGSAASMWELVEKLQEALESHWHDAARATDVSFDTCPSILGQFQDDGSFATRNDVDDVMEGFQFLLKEEVTSTLNDLSNFTMSTQMKQELQSVYSQQLHSRHDKIRQLHEEEKTRHRQAAELRKLQDTAAVCIHDETFDAMITAAIEESYSPVHAQMPWMFRRSLINAILRAANHAVSDIAFEGSVNLLAPVSGYAYLKVNESYIPQTVLPPQVRSTSFNFLHSLDSPLLHNILASLDNFAESIGGYSPSIDNCIDIVSSFGVPSGAAKDQEGSISAAATKALGHAYDYMSSTAYNVWNYVGQHLEQIYPQIDVMRVSASAAPRLYWLRDNFWSKLMDKSAVHLQRNRPSLIPGATASVVGSGSHGVVMPMCWDANAKSATTVLSFQLTHPAVITGIQVIPVTSNAEQPYYALPQRIVINGTQKVGGPLALSAELDLTSATARNQGGLYEFALGQGGSGNPVNQVSVLLVEQVADSTAVGLVCIGGLGIFGKLI